MNAVRALFLAVLLVSAVASAQDLPASAPAGPVPGAAGLLGACIGVITGRKLGTRRLLSNIALWTILGYGWATVLAGPKSAPPQEREVPGTIVGKVPGPVL